jgi:alkylation response protein AidB-like acyl-CoA dehydrogenase
MHVDYTPEQAALRDELRSYFGELITDGVREEMRGSEGGGPEYRRILKQLAADGWLGIGWPREYGGQGRSSIEQYIFAEEVQRVGFPLPFLTLGTVGPTIMNYGTEEQKQRFLRPILNGDLHFAIGYSEPDAGTDLASLKTRAVRDGDEWVVNGAKIWTSLADYADFIWLAVRTDPDAPKHRGISMFIVPTDAPGYKCTPIWTMAGVRTNATYFDDVRVPHENLVGGENRGWSLITGQLNLERISLVNVSGYESVFDDLMRWTKKTRLPDGRAVIDQPWVRQSLARCHAQIEVLKLMNWKQAWASTQGMVQPAESSAAKVYGTEMAVRIYEWMMEIIGESSLVAEGSPEAILRGRIERMYRAALILTFGGGTNEVQRDIIAMAGLGMPHYKN